MNRQRDYRAFRRDATAELRTALELHGPEVMPLLGKPASRIPIVRRHGRELLRVLIAHRDGGMPIDMLCERAAAALDEYGEILGDNLAQAAVPGSLEDVEGLRSTYVRILGEFAGAVCAVIPDPEARHTLAQGIQCAVLLHERRLREVTAPDDLRVACQP